MVDESQAIGFQIHGICGHVFCNQLRSLGVKLSELVFSGKLYRLSVCFNRGVWFDTLKNRVVTSSVILAPSESPAVFKS